MNAIIAGVEGMKAANRFRESVGYAHAYDETSFSAAEMDLSAIAERLRNEI